jgi:hypothetical protein
MGRGESARIGVRCEMPRGYMARASHSGSCEHDSGDQCSRQKFGFSHFVLHLADPLLGLSDNQTCIRAPLLRNTSVYFRMLNHDHASTRLPADRFRRTVRIARFGSTSSVWSNAGKPRTSSSSWHLPILRSYSSKSWLVPRFSLQIYCTAKEVGKALPLAAIALQMLMTTLQERLMPKRSSSCPFVMSLAPRARIGERTVDARRRTGSVSNLASSEA